MLKKNLNEPLCCTPRRNCRLMLAPGASGVPRVMVPALIELLRPPPILCVGGCSSVVPSTVTEQGVVATPFDARQVPASVTPLTTTLVEVNARRSAIPPGTASALISTMRNRNRVTGAPVLFTKRRLTERVPFVPLVIGVKSRTRFGDAGAPIFASSSNAEIVEACNLGAARFSGPGAP